MPRFHFHIVVDSCREHVGCMDLPHADAVVSTGVKVTARLLAGAARREVQGEGWSVQATDDAGKVVYNFNVSQRASCDDVAGCVH